ncbi:hypothetical protein D6D21_10401 [Aureobasidium pullulans]|uniref:ATP phosphoribosyltransferase n=1 Tax=Aureobasidium pullulans TaxID=5580 RepID=A0AB74IID7_AURPU|nr:hypothetical protein D6D21_10401 [Aureobasidium pullulans]
MSSPTPSQTPYKLIFFTPPTSLSSCKSAIFSTSLCGQFPLPNRPDTIGYKNVCWETTGTGQFIPGEDSTPDIGERGKLEVLEEVRVEVQVRGRENVGVVVEALKKAHPYEVPVYEVYKMEDF